MPPSHGIRFGEATRTWAWIGLNSFGGPAGQIAVMHRTLVDEKKWVGEHRFLHALNFCMLLPGPEAQQLAIYLGWLLHGVPGGLVAGTLFVLPGYVALLGLSAAYVSFHDIAWVGAALVGVKAAVLAVVLEAVVRIGRRVLKNGATGGIAAAAFLALFLFGAPFPVLIVGAAILGFLGGRMRPDLFVMVQPQGSQGTVDAILDRGVAPPSIARAARTAAIGLALWLAPVIALLALRGHADVYSRIAVFFSQTAAVTFGGAYAVLAYIAQRAVEQYHWLSPPEMLDGLGMAETTPGPLIMVVEYVGFIGAYRNPGTLPPMLAGFLGATLTTWVTFAPCFLWIFVGAPWIESLRGRTSLSAALSAITAAVVGVIVNLAAWLGGHVLFHATVDIAGWKLPDLASFDPVAAAIAAGAGIALLAFHRNVLEVLPVAAVLGVVAWWW
jgi:chromate transporter